jgi:hypothetical protein
MIKPSKKMIESVAQELEDVGIKVYNEDFPISKSKPINKIQSKDWFNFITKSKEANVEDITKFVGDREISLDQLMCLLGLLKHSILYSKDLVVKLYINLPREDKLKLKNILSSEYEELYSGGFRDICLDRYWILKMVSSFDSYELSDISNEEKIIHTKDSLESKNAIIKEIINLVKEYNINYLIVAIIGLVIGLLLSAFIFGMLIIVF